MNLWIRTQDRAGILKCEKLYIQVLNGEFHILNENEFPLGIYEARERALEVLDEIQSLLKEQVNLGVFIIDNKFTSRVYEMPKE